MRTQDHFPDPFAAMPEELLRAGTGLKWHAHPDDVLPMWVAEMDVLPAPAVVAAVSEAMASGNTGYPGTTGFAAAVAAFAADTWGWEVDPGHTVAVADVMTGIREVIDVISQPGDPVVVTPPVYGPFMDVVALAGRTRLDAPLGPDGRLDLACLDEVLAQARSQATGSPVLLLCSPHNPTGVVHTRDELTHVAALANQHGVRVVVDEIHAPLTRPGVEFTPWLTVDGAQAGLSVLSASKGFNLAALKAALVVAGPDAAADVEAVPELVRHGPSHTGMLAQAAALRDGRAWLGAVRAAIDDHFDLLADLLASQVPEVVMAPAEATYLAWLDFRDAGLGDDPATPLLERGRLALSEGIFFGTGGAGHARLNVATAPTRIAEAVRRIAAVVRDAQPPNGVTMSRTDAPQPSEHGTGGHDHGPGGHEIGAGSHGNGAGDDHDPARHFDERAADWDDEAKVTRSQVVASAIRDEVDVDAGTRVLEYGAGTGLTTQHLAATGPVGPATLVDPSAGMREVMAAKVADGRLPADARITTLDLATDDAPTAMFDLVVTVMALHHIPDVEAVLAGMAAALAPGGHLAVVDLDAEDGSFHADLEDFGGHDGFDRAGLTAMLTAAGFTTPSWRHVHEVVKHDRPYPLFLAVSELAH